MSLILAIDPGLTGAWALLERDGRVIALGDLPVIADMKTKTIDAAVLADRWLALIGERDVTGIIERVHPMPASGSQGAFSQGMTLGSSWAALRFIDASVEFVTPGSWKRDLGLLAPGATDIARKRASLDKARLLFPRASLDRQKDHGRAEALLIGYWYLKRDSLRAATIVAKAEAKKAAKALFNKPPTRELFSEWEMPEPTAPAKEPF